MTELLGTTETEFDTDFAILGAAQGNVGATAGTFAGSTTGALSARCGTKYARVHVRAERWTGRPEADSMWEDIDELPFAAIEDAGPLRLSGFDPPSDDHGLDLEGFGAGRVIVRANGRHRYFYGDGDSDRPPEEWLLQFFPEAGPPRPLLGPPRRLAGYSPYTKWDRRSGWAAAIHAWDQTGWDPHLHGSQGFYAIRLGLSAAGRAVSAHDLAERSAIYTSNGSPRPAPLPDNKLDVELNQKAGDPLAELYGAPIATLRDAINAMRKLQLLLEVRRGGLELLVPNPAPDLVWDVATLSEQQIQGVRLQIGYADFRDIAEDIAIAVNWAGSGGLQTTVQEMGIRWSTSSVNIRGGLSLSAKTSGVVVTPSLNSEEADDDVRPILITSTGYWNLAAGI